MYGPILICLFLFCQKNFKILFFSTTLSFCHNSWQKHNFSFIEEDKISQRGSKCPNLRRDQTLGMHHHQRRCKLFHDRVHHFQDCPLYCWCLKFFVVVVVVESVLDERKAKQLHLLPSFVLQWVKYWMSVPEKVLIPTKHHTKKTVSLVEMWNEECRMRNLKPSEIPNFLIERTWVLRTQWQTRTSQNVKKSLDSILSVHETTKLTKEITF